MITIKQVIEIQNIKTTNPDWHEDLIEVSVLSGVDYLALLKMTPEQIKKLSEKLLSVMEVNPTDRFEFNSVEYIIPDETEVTMEQWYAIDETIKSPSTEADKALQMVTILTLKDVQNKPFRERYNLLLDASASDIFGVMDYWLKKKEYSKVATSYYSEMMEMKNQLLMIKPKTLILSTLKSLISKNTTESGVGILRWYRYLMIIYSISKVSLKYLLSTYSNTSSISYKKNPLTNMMKMIKNLLVKNKQK